MNDQNPTAGIEESSDTDTAEETGLPITRRSVLKNAGALGVSGAFLASASGSVEGHDVSDHLVETPPMGWNSWNTFACDIDADLIKDTANAMVESGMKDAGYEYVNIDDCWMAPERDANGNLEPDPETFPNGIDGVADYVHNLDLQLGIYSSAGTRTCQGLPASLGHEETDAQSFADWGVDYLKYDNCYNQGAPPKERYSAMWEALEATGRDIVKSQCSWGVYEEWTWAADLGANLWRTTGDIYDDWNRIMDILDQQVGLAQYAKPGHWNDPDMLEVGNEGLSETESRAHFSLWCLLAAPLIAGNDVREMSDATRKILTNEEAIAINQDAAGIQGTKRRDDGDEEVWAKPLANGDVAVGLLNRGESISTITTTAEEVGLDTKRGPGYVVRDLWEKQEAFTTGDIAASVPSHAVAMLRIRPGTPNEAPPLTTFSAEEDTAFVLPGESQTITATFANEGRTAVQDVTLELNAPKGWDAETSSPTHFGAVAPGKAVEATWSVTPPRDAESDTYDLDISTTFRWQGETYIRQSGISVTIPPSPPTSDAYLSDLEWISATNGWGPVERDMSIGERDANDGQTITIDGTTYEKGLGCHAPSRIRYYLGGNCSRFTADVGIDDEIGDQGQVVFQLLTNGEIAYESDVVTGSEGPVPVDVDIDNADVLELAVLPDGTKNYDHADWGAAKVHI